MQHEHNTKMEVIVYLLLGVWFFIRLRDHDVGFCVAISLVTGFQNWWVWFLWRSLCHNSLKKDLVPGPSPNGKPKTKSQWAVVCYCRLLPCHKGSPQRIPPHVYFGSLSWPKCFIGFLNYTLYIQPLNQQLKQFTLPPSPNPTLSHCSQMAYLPLGWDLALFKIHFSTREFLFCKCLFSLFVNFLHGLRAADVTRQRLHHHLLPVFLLALGGGTCALVVSRGLLHRSVHSSSLSISAIDVSHFNKSHHAVTANSLGLAGLPLERIFKILETG